MTTPRRPLTNMEQVVAEALGRLATYRAVASELGSSQSTVRVHVHAIARKLENPDALAPSRLVLVWSAQQRWEKERPK